MYASNLQSIVYLQVIDTICSHGEFWLKILDSIDFKKTRNGHICFDLSSFDVISLILGYLLSFLTAISKYNEKNFDKRPPMRYSYLKIATDRRSRLRKIGMENFGFLWSKHQHVQWAIFMCLYFMFNCLLNVSFVFFEKVLAYVSIYHGHITFSSQLLEQMASFISKKKNNNKSKKCVPNL